MVVTFTDNINNCDEKDKSSFWSGCNVDFALSVGCNDFALGVVMIILFYKIKLKRVRVKKGRMERESGVCVGEVRVGVKY